MPILHKTPFGHVIAISGSALVRGADGHMHALKVGDAVHPGDVILTSQNGIVEMTDESGRSRLATLLPPDEATRAIAALNTAEPDAATSAGLAGGDGSLQPGLRVDRISEATSPAGFLSAGPLSAREFAFIGTGSANDAAPSAPPPAPANQAPSATPGAFSGNEHTSIPIVLGGTDSDGRVVGITVTSVPASGTLLLADGATPVVAGQTLTPQQGSTLLFRPADDYTNGQVEVRFTVTDDQGAVSTPGAAQIGVIAVNDLPQPHDDNTTGASNDALTTKEDTALTIAPSTLLANDADPDGDALGIASVQGATHGSVALVDGQVVFTPEANYHGPAAFTYTVDDGHGGSATATVNVLVTPVNDGPTPHDDNATGAADDALTTQEDTALTIAPSALLANDVDPDGDALSIASVQGATHGSVALVEGHVVFTPAANYSGPASFTYTVDDGHGGSATATVNVLVTPVNDLPVPHDDNATAAANDALTTNEDSALTIAASTLLANDVDPDGDALSIASVQGATHGTVALADGRIVFTPEANYNGPASFTYTVDDGHGGGATATVNIAVLPVNDLPLAHDDNATGASDDALTTKEDTALAIAPSTLLANDSDPDGDALGIASVQGATHGTVALVGGQIVFTPEANYHGPAAFTYTVDDGHGGSATASVNVDVLPANDPPVALDDVASTPENTPVTIAVLANDSDPDGDALVVTAAHIATGAGSVAVNPDGTLSYDPGSAYDQLAPGATATVAIAYDVADGHGGTSSAIATVTITGTNDGPIARPDVNSVSEDGPPALGNVLGDAPGIDSDIDGGSLVVTGVAAGVGTPAGHVGESVAGAWGALVVDADGHYTYTPGAAAQALVAGQSVTDSFSYAIADGQGGQASSTLTITVHGADDAPTFAGPLTGDVTEDGVLVAAGAIVVTDPDAGQSSMQPQSGSPGTYGSFSIDAGGAWIYTLNNPAANVQALAQGQTVTDSFVVTSDDGSTRTLVVSVHGTDDAPIALADIGTTLEDVTIAGNVLANDSDIDGGALSVTQFEVGGTTYLAGSTAALGGVGLLQIGADGGYSFTPVADYHGPVPTATYTVSDGMLASTSTLTLGVTPVNDPPLARNDAFATDEDTPLAIAASQLLANDSDADGDTLLVTSVQDAIHGSVSLAGGQVVFTPDANYSGPASFSYTIADGHGESSTATVMVGVRPVNDPPVAIDDAASTLEDTPLAGNVLANDSDLDGPIAVTTFAIGGATYGAGTTVALAGVGSLTINADGSYLFAPAPEYSGPVPVATYTISDGQSAASAKLTLSVTPVDDVPATHADACSATEGSNAFLPGNVLANDSDAEGDTLHVSYVATNPDSSAVAVDGIVTIATALGGTVIMNASGSYRYIAPARDHADATPDVDSFVYRASDGHGDSGWTTVNIAIDDSTPTAVADAANVAFNGTVGGNLLFNDLSVDVPRSVTSVSFGGVEHAVAAGGTTTIDTPEGMITVSSDGAYTYTSQLPPTAVLTGGTLAQWEQTTDLYGFQSGNAWQSGSGLNLGALDATAAGRATYVGSGSKPGIGVTGGGSTIGSGEQLIVHLHETAVHATLGIAQLNANQGLANAHWSAYDASGQLVSSGDFAGAPLNNGNEYKIDIDTGGQAFSYLRFSWSSNSQGYVLSDLEIERMPANHTESFGYTMRDADGDIAQSTFTVVPAAASSVQTATLDGSAAHDDLIGDARDNVVNGNDGNDLLYGNAGRDTLSGGAGHDYLVGGTGNDRLDGGEGNDILVGGAGNDQLIGGNGADVFAWNFADHGAPGAPASDAIADFNLAAPTAGGDVLDLRDLLQGEQNVALLDRYLEFDTTSQPGSTVIHVSSAGGFTPGAGWSAAQAGAEDQSIVLQGISDIRGALSLDAGASDNQVIQELVNRGKLLVDHGA